MEVRIVMQKQITITDVLEAFKKSIENFDNLPKDIQKKKAMDSLIRTGVLNSDGTPKEHICTID